MSKVSQHLIDEAAKRGIVPGAFIQCAAYCGDSGIVSPMSEWCLSDSGSFIVGVCSTNDSRLRAKAGNVWATVITPAPASEPEGLKENDVCRCGPAMRGGIIETAEAIGLPIHEGVSDGETWPHLSWANGLLSGCREGGYKQSLLNFITPEAFIAKMRVTAALPKPIKIDGHEVKYEKGHIKVGCQNITNATVRAIAEKLID